MDQLQSISEVHLVSAEKGALVRSTMASESLKREPEDELEFGLLTNITAPAIASAPYGTITPPEDLILVEKTATADFVAPQTSSVAENQTLQSVCANCNKSKATKTCSGCKDAPPEDGVLHKAPSYCDAVCQSAHWKVHKTECKLRQASKQVQALSRAGHLLSKLFFVWREACYDRPTVKVEAKNNSIYIYEDWCKSLSFHNGGRHRLLNDSLFNDEEIKKAVLANMGCDVSLAFIHEVIRRFLEGITTSIHEVEVMVKGTFRPIYIIDASNGQCQLQGPHHVLKVKIKSGSSFAVDMTASQFGWADIVTPWSKYFENHCQRIHVVEELGGRSAFFQKIIEEPGVAEDDIRAFATWTRSMGDMLSEVVDDAMEQNNMRGFFNGTDSRWRKKETALLKRVREEMTLAARDVDRVWAEQVSKVT